MESDSADELGDYEVEEIWLEDSGDEDELIDMAARGALLEDTLGRRMEEENGGGGGADMPDFRMNGRGAPPDQKLQHEMGSGGPPRSLMQVSSNTGPKGVKADYERAKLNALTIKGREELRRQRELAKQSRAGQRPTGPSIQQQEQDEQARDKAVRRQQGELSSSDSDSDLEDSDADDEIFKAYRQQQLQQLQMVANSLPTFGVFRRVDFDQFATLVKQTHEMVNVVAHIYENHILECTKINLALEDIAADYPHVCFVRIRASDAMARFKDAGLPAFLVFRGGKMIQDVVCATKQLGPAAKLTDEVLIRFLAGLGVLKDPAAEFNRMMGGGGGSGSGAGTKKHDDRRGDDIEDEDEDDDDDY